MFPLIKVRFSLTAVNPGTQEQQPKKKKETRLAVALISKGIPRKNSSGTDPAKVMR